MLPYRFRFKVALDSQIPTLIGLFVSAMFNVEFPIWIGSIVSLFVTFIALKALVPVRIEPKKEEE
jgi:L-lactate permease